MIKRIKYYNELLKETILKFIKQYTHKYVPISILLSLYTLFFSILWSDTNQNEINKNEKYNKYLTKKII